MKKQIISKLYNKINDLTKNFSKTDREKNFNNETFKCYDITPLSDTVALVTLVKNTGKQANALFFYIKDYWIYFFPSDSHEYGMFNYLNNAYRIHLENFNLDKNFVIKKEKKEVVDYGKNKN